MSNQSKRLDQAEEQIGIGDVRLRFFTAVDGEDGITRAQLLGTNHTYDFEYLTGIMQNDPQTVFLVLNTGDAAKNDIWGHEPELTADDLRSGRYNDLIAEQNRLQDEDDARWEPIIAENRRRMGDPHYQDKQ